VGGVIVALSNPGYHAPTLTGEESEADRG